MHKTTKFYEFDQNNSGGHFSLDPERGIGCKVIVEAYDSFDADSRAEDIGLYFDGCESEIDCSCCGDRWYRSWEGDGETFIDMLKSLRATGEARLKFFGISTRGSEVYIHFIEHGIVTVTYEEILSNKHLPETNQS